MPKGLGPQSAGPSFTGAWAPGFEVLADPLNHSVQETPPPPRGSPFRDSSSLIGLSVASCLGQLALMTRMDILVVT